jgi:hypothetical protein
MTNVTNEFIPIAAGGLWPIVGYDYQFVAPPRMWGARLRYRFGG